ncbi:MAG: AbrB/MazE/SpoVT family DNA-binding domain-containing protein [Elusimicrobia bacterium]|nr:AbrB/MazE/SpoVT family DNA-binding domain-containing protein [Elusimicrobiota bacterium]
MEGSVQKWGNSLALRIPRALAEDARLREGSAVELEAVEGGLLVRPKRRGRVSLARLLKGVTPGNLHDEASWGGPRGKEAW